MEGTAMSAGGQRNDVKFLAMAIGALVVAVALFVGIRSLSQKPAPVEASEERTEKKVAKSKKSEAKEKSPALTPSSRDPFASVGAAEVPVTNRRLSNNPRAELREARGSRTGAGRNSGSAPDPEADPDMRLAGIMRGSGVMALIHVGDARYYAQIGDVVGGFKLVQIGRNSVVLTNGSRAVTLTIQPEPGTSTRARVRTTRRR
jgi:hypothetical protein